MNVTDYSPDPAAVEAEQIQARRRLAELLLQKGMSDQPVYSSRAGWARMISGALGGAQLQSANRDMKELAGKQAASREADFMRLADLLKPPVHGADLPQVDDNGNPMPGNVAETQRTQRERAMQLVASRDPTVQKVALSIAAREPERPQPFTLAEGASRYDGMGRPIASNPKRKEPEKEPESVRSLRAYMKSAGIDPESDIGRSMFEGAARKATTHQPGTTVNVDNAAAKPFWGEFGKSQAEAFSKEQEQAKGAAQMLQSIGTAKDLLSKGIYSGTAADWRLQAGKALKQAGFNMNQDDIANTEAFVSTMGNQVLAGIKQLGAGSAISNADREFMEKVVGGKLSLDPKGMERILSISEQMARARIGAFNQRAKALQSKAPAGFLPYGLEVQEPAQITVDDALKLYGSGSGR